MSPHARGFRRYRAAAFAALANASLVAPAFAHEPVLHEFIPPDDGEDLTMAVTTADGDLPAALDTPSGIVRAPDTQRMPTRSESAYRDSAGSSLPSVFRPDRDTRRPSMVHYDDPFSPSVAPYKRLRAYDSVGADYGLRVFNPALTRVATGGDARVGEEEFYADLTVDFEGAGPVLIPSVGPGTRILRMHTTPALPIEVWKDGADNWFAKTNAAAQGRVHLVMQIAIARIAFGGDFTMPSWENLRSIPRLPPMAARSFAKVEAALGLSRSLSPTETVRRLVSYFRSFTPSEDPPTGHRDIYLDLALSQKGVCRHRAFAFLVTALGLGIAARVVTNEAHAWVEVEADGTWRRIDLGGAAGAIDEGSAEARPAYKPPNDPFEWPKSDNGSGSQVAARGRRSSSGASNSARGTRDNAETSSSSAETTSESGARAAPSESGAAERASGALDGAETSGPRGGVDDRPRSRVTLIAADATVRHGAAIHVAGRVDVDGSGCGDMRVDIALHRGASKTKVGSLTTDASGAFDGQLFLPMSLAAGEYDIAVSSPGDARCGPGSSGL